MSDYLNNIVARTLNLADAVQPRLPQLFEQPTAFVPVETVQDAAFSEAESLQTSNVPVRPTLLDPIEAANRFDKIVEAPVPSSVLGFETLRAQPEEKSNAATVNSKPGSPTATESHVQDTPLIQSESSNARSRSAVEQQTTLAVRKPERTTTAGRLQNISAEPRMRESQNQRSEVQSPTIKITIGRVDVRAIMPTAPPAPIPSTRPKGALSLENYLKQREEGKR